MGCSASISIKEPRDLIEVCEKKNIAYVKKFLTVANIERFDYLALDYAKRDPLVLKTFLDSDLVQGKDLIERKEYFDRKALIAFLKHPKGSNHIHMGYIVWTDDCEMLKTSLDHYGLLPDYDYLDLVEKTYKKSVNLVRILMTHSRGLKNISINKCIITGLEYLKEYVDFVVDHLLNHKCKEFDSYDICIYAIRIGNEHLLSKYLPFCEEKIADEFSNKRVIEFEKGLGADVVYTLFNNFYLASTSNNLCYHKKIGFI